MDGHGRGDYKARGDGAGKDVIPNVYIHGNPQDLKVVVDESPDAWLFKGEVRSTLKAWVCGACGYAELYAQDPAALLAAYRKHAEQG